MEQKGKKDLFPICLALSFAVLAAVTVVLFVAAHPVWAVVAAVSSALVALPLTGLIVAGPFLEADIVVTIRAKGGQMPMADLIATREPDDRLITRLTKNGVISLADGTVFLREEKVGRVLASFVRLRSAK